MAETNQDLNRQESVIPASQQDKNTATRQLFLAAIFGMIFGFLLQKGGVAKYHILMGALLLEDFTVFKVMLSAIVVGMIGVYFLHSRGLIQLHIKPTRYASNIIGGLIFGAGFGFAGYCPGTTSAAFGQGNYDAFFVMAGMVAGGYLFAEMSGWIAQRIENWGNRGELTLPQLLNLPKAPFIAGFSVVLIIFLYFFGTIGRY